MPSPARFRPLLLLLLNFAILAAAHAAPPKDPKSQQAQAQQQLSEVRDKMQALTKQQADTAARRDSVNEELAKQANAVAVAARALRKTNEALAAKQRDLEQLQQQRNEAQQNLQGQHAAIADLLRATYALGHGSDLRVLLGDEDVARIARGLAYSKYFQQDRLQRVQTLMDQLAKLQDLETAITAEQQALQSTREQRQQQNKALEQQRAAQQKLYAEVDAQYKDQGQRLGQLKQDAQSLNQLVDKLQKAIEQAEREAEAAARANPSGSAPSKAANIRGNLPWPAAGAVRSYGNGVLIGAPQGSEVHAVASGKVVFANFLRGYGMLIILNHGNGWLSMYGNNESVLHGVGDQVESGQALGTASAVTGANTGVYFELRQNNKPVDPRSWLSRRR